MADDRETILIRPPTTADLDGVVAMIAACEQAIRGTADEADERRVVAGDWEREDVDLAEDAWVAELPGGQIVGYEIAYDLRSPEAAGCDGFVHPDHLGRGIGTRLLRRAVERVAREAAALPAEQQVRMRVSVYEADGAARALLTAEGFATVRHHWQMQITMAEPPELPAPAGIRIAEFRPIQDERAAYEALEEAFADHWGHAPESFEAWRQAFVARDDFDPTLCRLAWDGGELAGAALGYQRTDQGWVRLLGVRRPWRRRGVGIALLQHVFAAFYARGTSTVGLGVDAASPTGATRLYERAGMRPVAHVDTYERVLRQALGAGAIFREGAANGDADR